MDASKDSMNVTYQFLRQNRVEGSTVLPFEQLVELINGRVEAARPYLREVTLRAIDSQVVFRTQLPNDFGQQRALKVYSFGDDAWDDAEVAQYWFVDRDGRWLWAKYDSMGGRQDFAEVSVVHFAETRRVAGAPHLAHIACLWTISEAFKREFERAAESARKREESMRAAATKQAKFTTALNAITS